IASTTWRPEAWIAAMIDVHSPFMRSPQYTRARPSRGPMAARGTGTCAAGHVAERGGPGSHPSPTIRHGVQGGPRARRALLQRPGRLTLERALALQAAGAPAGDQVALHRDEEDQRGNRHHHAGGHDQAPVDDRHVEELVDAD